ncbi:Cysteine desulfurase, mitochondrial [Schistosoma japonicum]|nr:Cysteine desulfurase, mitochondrial [Schistosoma japonicum]
MFGRLSVLYAPAYRRTFYLARHFCAEAELLVEDGNKSKSYKSLRPIYFDFQASTQVDPRVLDAMLPFYINYFGNPHSRTHEYGWYCEEAIEKARMNVARLINADHKEVIFTSGATESNNLAVKGVAKFYYPKKKHIVTTQIEHKCVLDSCRVLENSGFEVTYLPVKKSGIDLMSISGHKIYGPQGIGALYIRRRPRVRLEAQQSGGGQERGLRSGTLPTALVVGLGEASRVASEEMKDDYEHVSALSKRLIDGITSKIQHVTLNGDPVQRYPGCVNFSFAYVEGESLLMALKNIALSSGSACTSASLEPSYVLRAIGTEEDLAHSSIRFGIGRFTTEEEVDFTITEITKHVQRLREMSPLWEMVSEGIDIKSIQWTQH